MNYVVFDLEWNQCPYGKHRENKRLPFEIIEIGAIKLNSEREIVDTFHRVVRPTLYTTLHYRTREIVHLTKEDLANGLVFPEAVREFLAWAGPASRFCTWGTVDLVELQRNMKYYGLLHLLKGPIHFFDVQKLFAITYEDMKSRRALEYGIDYLGLVKDQDFHRALSDTWYTALIFQTIDMAIVLAYDSIDAYQPPKSKTSEIHAVYNGYYKFISRLFPDKENAMADKEVLMSPCPLCGRSTHKKMRWFSVNAKNYYCIGICPKHGYVKGKIRMRHADEGGYFVVKTIKVSSEPEADMIMEKREEMRAKRRRRAHRGRR